MATFHGFEVGRAPEEYSRLRRAATCAAALALVAAAAGLLLVAAPRGRPAAWAIVAAALSPAAGALLPGLGSRARIAAGALLVGAVVAVGSGAASLGFLAASLAAFGAGVVKLAPASGPLLVALADAASLALPFVLAAPGASPESGRLAARLFEWSPLAAAARSVGVDLLRSDRLYAVSELGSSLNVGYPSAWLVGGVLALGAVVLFFAARPSDSLPPSAP